jgi:hypothetical protein
MEEPDFGMEQGIFHQGYFDVDLAASQKVRKTPERVLLKQIDRNQRILHQFRHYLAERLHAFFNGTLILGAQHRADDKPKLIFGALEVGREPRRERGQDGAGKEAHHAIHAVCDRRGRDQDLVDEWVAGQEVQRLDCLQIAKRGRVP